MFIDNQINLFGLLTPTDLHSLAYSQTYILWFTPRRTYFGLLPDLHSLTYSQTYILWLSSRLTYFGLLPDLYSLAYSQTCILWLTPRITFFGLLPQTCILWLSKILNFGIICHVNHDQCYKIVLSITETNSNLRYIF